MPSISWFCLTITRKKKLVFMIALEFFPFSFPVVFSFSVFFSLFHSAIVASYHFLRPTIITASISFAYRSKPWSLEKNFAASIYSIDHWYLGYLQLNISSKKFVMQTKDTCYAAFSATSMFFPTIMYVLPRKVLRKCWKSYLWCENKKKLWKTVMKL